MALTSREPILARSFQVLAALKDGTGYEAVERNVLGVSAGPDGQLPRRLVMLDGRVREDRERRVTAGRLTTGPLGQVMISTIELHIFWGAPAADVGAALEARLTEALSALMYDTTLLGLLLPGEPPVLVGADSGYSSQLQVPGLTIAAVEMTYRFLPPPPA